jgi:hypothetical protein
MIKLKTPDVVHQAISEKLAKGVSYMEALVAYAQETDIEIELLAEIVKKSPVIREKLREEAVGLNLMKEEVTGLGKFC